MMLRNPFEPMLDIFKVVKYATTDQEKEGRELGIKAAANIYKPVLKNLEIRQVKIITATDKEQSFFEGQTKSLKRQCSEYEQKTADLAAKIKKQSSEKSKAVDTILRVNGFGSGAMSGGDFISAIGEALSLAWSVINFIDNEMEEKRSYYRKVEFEKQSRVWEEKIKEIRKEIAKSIKNLKSYKISNREQIEYISAIVDDAIKEYCETLAKYNALKEMGN